MNKARKGKKGTSNTLTWTKNNSPAEISSIGEGDERDVEKDRKKWHSYESAYGKSTEYINYFIIALK